MRVVAVETRNNRGSAPVAGFYGSGSLNKRRIQYGQQFTINDTPTNDVDKAKRQSHLDSGVVSFTNEKDVEAYLGLAEFASWMTVDLSYVPAKAVKRTAKNVGSVDGGEGETEDLSVESIDVPTGRDRSGSEVVTEAPISDAEALKEPIGAKRGRPKRF